MWIKSSKKTSYPLKKRKFYLEKAYITLKSYNTDKYVTKNLSKIAYQYFKLKDTIRFKELNKEAYKLALSIKDTFTLADISWNRANYYKKAEVYDSAYYYYNKAYIYFESINQQNYAAKMLFGMSFIKGRYKEYYGSEILIIKAISKYKLLKNNKDLYASYNHLALLQSDIKEYDKALFYHNKALKYLNKLKNKGHLYETSLNNIGNIYVEKKEYLKALKYYNKILDDDNLKTRNIEDYARVLDNRAYCKLLNKDTVNIKQDFYTALKIRDSINDKEAVELSKIHLAKYYMFVKKFVKAKTYAKEANILAKGVKNSDDYLESLKLLSKLDTKNANNYLLRYITYNDSLQNINRKTQNKFTRIAYETDEYIEKNNILSQQKITIIVIGLVILLLLSLIYYIIIQRSKNKRLLLEYEQQQKLEEEKTKERNRISQELHDDILGTLFGVRINLGFLNIKGDNDTLKQHDSFLEELKNIEKDIREVSHKLNSSFNISKIDFTYILEQFLKNKGNLVNFAYKLNIDKSVNWNKIDKVIKINLYRILQEALQNIIKYAKAKNVIIDFSVKKNNLIVCINDNGIGFKVKKPKKGIGIKNMKSRIKKINGKFSVISKIGKGTTIHFTIPIH